MKEAPELAEVPRIPAGPGDSQLLQCTGSVPEHVLPISSPARQQIPNVHCLSAEDPGHSVDTWGGSLGLGNCRPK